MARTLLRFVVAAALSLAVAATLALMAGRAQQFLFVPVLAVAAVALVLGVGPGLVSAVVTTASCAVLFYPAALPETEVIRIGGVGITTAVIAWAAGSVRRAYERAAAERIAADTARLQAERAVVLRDEVLAVVSHDLKSPLATTKFVADMLERKYVPHHPEMGRQVAAIRQNVASMDRLILDLLDVASIEVGRLSVRPAPEDLAELAREAVSGISGFAEDAGVRVSSRLTSVLVSCDGQRILQVLRNLLTNAVKATPPGGQVVVDARVQQGEVVVTVSDDGCGIPADELPHVFDRFCRGRTATYQGSGLGLAIVKGIVEAHGGRVSAQSGPGKGTRVKFTFPVGKAAPENAWSAAADAADLGPRGADHPC